MFRQHLKHLGRRLLSRFNFMLPRNLNGQQVLVPVRCGVKVGISAEKWMSELLTVIFGRDDGAFLDVGVNLGQTLVKVKTLAPDREYVGIEPNPACIYYLHQLIRNNRWENTLLIPAGLFNANGLLNLTGSSDTDGSSTIIDAFKPDDAATETASRLVPLYSYATLKNYLPEKRFSTIKIDVEGGELEVLKELSPRVQADRPYIIIEVWNNDGDPLKTRRTKALNELIDSLDYESFSWRISADKSTYLDFARATPGEHQGTDNYLLAPREKCAEAITLFARQTKP